MGGQWHQAAQGYGGDGGHAGVTATGEWVTGMWGGRSDTYGTGAMGVAGVLGWQGGDRGT